MFTVDNCRPDDAAEELVDPLADARVLHRRTLYVGPVVGDRQLPHDVLRHEHDRDHAAGRGYEPRQLMGCDNIRLKEWHATCLAEGFGDRRQVLHDDRRGEVADSVRPDILLEEPHQRDHLGVVRAERDDLLARAQDRLANVLRAGASGTPATTIAKTVLGRLAQIKLLASSLPGRVVLRLRNGQHPSQHLEMAPEPFDGRCRDRRITRFREQDRVDEEGDVHVEKGIDQSGSRDRLRLHAEVGGKQDRVLDAGHPSQ